MILLLLGSVVLLGVLGLLHLRAAVRGVPAIVRLVRTRTKRIADLTEGNAEIAGTIRAVGDAVRSPTGRECVYVDVEVTGMRGKGKQRFTVHSERIKREAVAEVVDSDGAAVRLDFEHVEIVAPAATTRVDFPLLGPDATSYCRFETPVEDVSLQERVIPSGVQVFVSGVARVVDAKVEASVSGYRDGVPVEKKTFVFGGAAKARMIVSEGSEAELLWRATWPVALLAATSTSAFLFAALVIQLMRA